MLLLSLVFVGYGITVAGMWGLFIHHHSRYARDGGVAVVGITLTYMAAAMMGVGFLVIAILWGLSVWLVLFAKPIIVTLAAAE